MPEIIAEDIAECVAEPLPWDRFSGATILVTGASGFLPAYMVETLLFLNASARIIAVVRNRETARARFSPYLENPNLEFLVQDICDPIALRGNVDYVIHAASQSSPRFYQTDPVGTLSANTIGTYNLLKSLQNHRLKGFLFFSSGEAYGTPSPDTHRITENDFGYLNPTDVRACYGESKRMGETMCIAWSHQFGVPIRIVRPFHTYGPGMRLDDGRVFADFVRDILSAGPIVLQSDGSARRCFCYLGDANRAFFTVLLNGGDGEAYNVANPLAECSIRQLADRLADLYKVEGVRVQQTCEQARTSNPLPEPTPDIGKITALGWIPRVTIEDGFRRTVNSYRSHISAGLAALPSE